jgi:hypothetical protein
MTDEERKEFRIHNLDRVKPNHTRHYGHDAYEEDGFSHSFDTADEAEGFARDLARGSKQRIVIRNKAAEIVWSNTVTVDAVDYRIDHVSTDRLGARYDAVRLSNGKQELAADIHRLNTGDRMETFPAGIGGITQELANRIAIAARQGNLIE